MNEEQDLFEKTFDELWKREEYNFGTTDEDGYHNFDDYTEYPFATDEMSILAEEYQKLKQQLQAYKDKEYKIRECCMPLITLNNIDCCKECGSTNIKQNYKPYKIAEDILQILNEGDK